jgi:hypothetical protein
MVRLARAAAARVMAARQNCVIASWPWMGWMPSAMSWACLV